MANHSRGLGCGVKLAIHDGKAANIPFIQFVIAASDTKEFWRTVNEDDLGRWLATSKLLALGSVAEQLFNILELDIGSGYYGFSYEVRVDTPALLSTSSKIDTPDTSLMLWPPTNKYNYALCPHDAAGTTIICEFCRVFTVPEAHSIGGGAPAL